YGPALLTAPIPSRGDGASTERERGSAGDVLGDRLDGVQGLVDTGADDLDAIVGHALFAEVIEPLREPLARRREGKDADLDVAGELVARAGEHALVAGLALAAAAHRDLA